MSSTAMLDDLKQSLFDSAVALIGKPVDAVEPARRGGNNRLYRVSSGRDVYALKVYPSQAEDPRDRIGAEFGTLDFLSRHDVPCVPRAFNVDRSQGLALYQWIEGEAVDAPTDDDIAAAATFAGLLKELAVAEDALDLPAAAEACPSIAELENQVDRRMRRLEEVAAENKMLARFLETALQPLTMAIKDWSMEACARAGIDRHVDLDKAYQTLSPSDFGFHNTLRQADGSLVFLDFEYFGWDDPVRLVADFLLHPGMRLKENQKENFARTTIAMFGGDGFKMRLSAAFPLVGLRWICILLNEFLPERWARRAFAGASDKEQAQQRQLAKAQAAVDFLQKHFRTFPYA